MQQVQGFRTLRFRAYRAHGSRLKAAGFRVHLYKFVGFRDSGF